MVAVPASTRSTRAFRPEPLLAAVAAATIAGLLLWLGPPGTDLAAHVYQRALFLEHGFALWNNLWYAGRYDFVTYSLLYYPLAAVLGIHVLAVASVAVATLAFSVVCERRFGRPARWSSRSFAVVWPGVVLTAAYPFMLGAALALMALWAALDRRPRLVAALAVLTLAASPLAFLLLALVLAASAITDRSEPSRLRVPAAAIFGCLALELLLRRLFPGGGRFPFSLVDLAAAATFTALGIALTRHNERARQLYWFFVVYLVVCAVAFLVPSDLGANVTRLRFAAIPLGLLVISLRSWRPLPVCLAALALAAGWNLTPIARALTTAPDPAARPGYWSPAIAFLRHHDTSYRTEVVDTAGHWAAVYLPEAGIPIARGWYRQNDFPQNRLLYEPLRAAPYRAWLRSLGVRYVVLADAPVDYSARAEAALLRSGHSGLRRVMRTHTLSIYAVPRPRPLLTGPAAARVLALGETWLRLRVAGPGRYRLAVHYSPYWRADRACVTEAAGGMTSLVVRRAGTIRLTFDVDARTALHALLGAPPRRSCPRPTGSSSVHGPRTTVAG